MLSDDELKVIEDLAKAYIPSLVTTSAIKSRDAYYNRLDPKTVLTLLQQLQLAQDRAETESLGADFGGEVINFPNSVLSTCG